MNARNLTCVRPDGAAYLKFGPHRGTNACNQGPTAMTLAIRRRAF
jgi:hypothetical protein